MSILNCRRLLKIQYVIAIRLMRWLTNVYDFRVKRIATAGIWTHPTKAWFSQLVNFKNAIWLFNPSTLQIVSVAFPPGQCTSPPLHPCHILFDQDGHQHSSSPSLYPDLAPCDFWSFHKLRGCRYEIIEEMKEAVTKVIDKLTQEDFHGAF